MFSLIMGSFLHYHLFVTSLYWFSDNNLVALTSITNEWPRGVTLGSSGPEGIDLASTGSDISAELASVLKPR